MSDEDNKTEEDPAVIPRREFLKRSTLVGGGLVVSQGLLNERPDAPPKLSSVKVPEVAELTTAVRLNVNGRNCRLRLEPRMTLLDALRDL
jgi:hypothetical protein